MKKSYYGQVCETIELYGTEQATLPELFALVIGRNSNSEVCQKLSNIPLRNLLHMKQNEFEQFEGIGPVTAKRLEAMISLFKQFSKRSIYEENLPQIKCPLDIYNATKYLRYENQEHFVALFLDTKNRVIGQKIIFIGSLNSSVVHPREIFREAIKHSSASIAVVHNHPSGDPSPSREDISFTHKLHEASRLVGIDLLDHIIIGDNRYVSLKEEGYI